MYGAWRRQFRCSQCSISGARHSRIAPPFPFAGTHQDRTQEAGTGQGGRGARVAAPLRPAPQASLRTHQQLGIRHRCSPAGSAGAARALRILPSLVSPSLDSSPFRRTLLRNLTRPSDSLRCSSSLDRRRVPVFSVRPVSLLAADWACISPSGDGTISGVGPLVGGQGSSPPGTSQPAHESTTAPDLILGDCETCEVDLADGRFNPSDSLAQEKRGRAERALASW